MGPTMTPDERQFAASRLLERAGQIRDQLGLLDGHIAERELFLKAAESVAVLAEVLAEVVEDQPGSEQAMSARPMMACGHAANATTEGRPVCVICLGIPEAEQIDESPPDLSPRQAVCSYSRDDSNQGKHSVGQAGRGYQVTPHPVQSSTSLPFFEHKPDAKFDRYYCGCFGWD